MHQDSNEQAAFRVVEDARHDDGESNGRNDKHGDVEDGRRIIPSWNQNVGRCQNAQMDPGRALVRGRSGQLVGYFNAIMVADAKYSALSLLTRRRSERSRIWR